MRKVALFFSIFLFSTQIFAQNQAIIGLDYLSGFYNDENEDITTVPATRLSFAYTYNEHKGVELHYVQGLSRRPHGQTGEDVDINHVLSIFNTAKMSITDISVLKSFYIGIGIAKGNITIYSQQNSDNHDITSLSMLFGYRFEVFSNFALNLDYTIYTGRPFSSTDDGIESLAFGIRYQM